MGQLRRVPIIDEYCESIECKHVVGAADWGVSPPALRLQFEIVETQAQVAHCIRAYSHNNPSQVNVSEWSRSAHSYLIGSDAIAFAVEGEKWVNSGASSSLMSIASRSNAEHVVGAADWGVSSMALRLQFEIAEAQAQVAHCIRAYRHNKPSQVNVSKERCIARSYKVGWKLPRA